MFFKIALGSLQDRKGSVAITLLAIVISLYVLLGIDHLRGQIKQSFSSTIVGTDLIVGARTGDINLLFYAIFHLGEATQNISWQTYSNLAALSEVKWAVPISLGDSHKGYRVTATTQDYFKYYQYGSKQPLQFNEGQAFNKVYQVVLGSNVAEKLNYQLGDNITLSHGIGQTSFSEHKDSPFTIVGILQKTGTPVDRGLYINLQSMEAIHIGWGTGSQTSVKVDNPDALQPETVTAILLGLEKKATTFRLQRVINGYKQEALLAILPGVALSKLWNMTATVEGSLTLVSILVFLLALLGMVTMLLASIRERRREIAVMRAMGAKPVFIFMLIQLEVMLMTLVAYASALVLLFGSISLMKDTILTQFGVLISHYLAFDNILQYFGLIIVSAFIVGLIPAVKAYREALNTRLN